MLFSWLARRRDYRVLVEAEATLLIETEGSAGYLARLARERGDVAAEKLWGRVARRVADRTGLVPGHSKIGRPESEW